MNRSRGGFTLVELIVVAVLGALLMAAALQVLITNQQSSRIQTAQIQGQQTTRAALDVLWGELREVSTRGGDLLSMSQDSLRVRVMRTFGLACAIDTTSTGQPRMKVLRIGDAFLDGDSAFVFADNNQTTANDDRWIRARITQTDSTVVCGSSRATQIVFAGQRPLFAADSVRLGAPVRSHVTYTYGLYALEGQYYLGRKAPGSDPVPMVGPLAATGGLNFSYRDSLGVVTTDRTLVRQIVVTIRTSSQVRNQLGQIVSDSIRTWIYTRN